MLRMSRFCCLQFENSDAVTDMAVLYMFWVARFPNDTLESFK